MIDFQLAERRRLISGQMPTPHVTYERRRIVSLGQMEVELEVEREMNGISVHFIEDGKRGPKRYTESGWKPGAPTRRHSVSKRGERVYSPSLGRATATRGELVKARHRSEGSTS